MTMKLRKHKDWCLGLSVNKETTRDGYSITFILLFILVQLNFKT